MIKKILKNILPEKIKVLIIEILSKRHAKKMAKNFYNKNRFTYTPSDNRMRPDTKVGQFTSIANNAWIAPGNHPLDMLTTSPFYYAPYNEGKPEFKKELAEKIMSDIQNKKTEIGNDVWIGINTTVLQGIKIGDGAVVGANSLVTKDVPPYAIVGGVPAHIIRYRFSENQIKQLLRLKWWNLSMKEINTLPFENIEACISKIEQIRAHKQKAELLFIVTSVLSVSENKLSYSKCRSIYTEEERVFQTKQTLMSIRKYVPNATIWLVEGGKKNYQNEKWEEKGLCDKYFYVGNNNKIRKAVDSRYKGSGEARMLLAIMKYIQNKDAAFIFKISGRYQLNDRFDIGNFDFERFNFKNYTKDTNVYCGESRYRKGSHSTRLYGIPNNQIKIWEKALKRSIWKMQFTGKGIEDTLCKNLRGDLIFYQPQLGIEGNIAVNGEKIEE